MNLDVVREMLVHPLALLGLGDGGAHVGTVCDASMPTFLLTHWARDRAHGIPLERVVQMQAHDTARFIGLADRGTLEVGMRADLNVIDLDAARAAAPGDAARSAGRRAPARASAPTAIVATLVGGEVDRRARRAHRRAPGPARAHGDARDPRARKRAPRDAELSHDDDPRRRARADRSRRPRRVHIAQARRARSAARRWRSTGTTRARTRCSMPSSIS